MGAIFCFNLTKISGKKVAAFFEKIWYTFSVEIIPKILMNWIFKNKKTPSKTKVFMTIAENKNVLQGKKTKGLLLALFFVGGFLFFQTKNAQAAQYDCICRKDTSAGTVMTNVWTRNFTTEISCNDACIAGGGTRYCYFPDLVNLPCDISRDSCVSKNAGSLTQRTDCKVLDSAIEATDNPSGPSTTGASVTPEQAAQAPAPADGCSVAGNVVKGDFEAAFKCLLYGLLQFLGWMLSFVATLFQWVVTPSNISGPTGLLNQMVVKNVWVMVRDILNMTFIMILLFAAFCTVFQVDSWNLKKVWLQILINALLVNFSFPIARIFIDISNVAMYYFLNNLFSGTGGGNGSAIMTSFSKAAQLSVLLTPEGYATAQIPYLLASIIFTFILGTTLLVLAALFVIRLVALTMLLMFSPIGFVGYIFPGTSKFASDWWSNLFNYSFFGPVMVFMMMVAIAIMKAAPLATFTTAAAGNTGGGVSASWLGSAAFFSIPIIILWTAMGISQKMGIEGASMVVGKGQALAKWAGNTFGGNQARWLAGLPGKGMGLVGKGAKMGATSLAHKFDRDVLKSWSPRALKAGWDTRSKDIENKHMSVASGAWHDRLNKALKSGKTNYQELAEHQLIAKRQKELLDGGIDESADQLVQVEKLLGDNSKTAQTDIQAFMRMIIGQNDHDDLMKWIQGHVDAKKGAGDDVGKKLMAMGINKNNYNISNGEVAHAIDKILEASGVDEEHRNTHLQDLGSIAVAKGGIMFGLTEVDDKTGKRKKTYTVDKKTGEVDASKASELAAKKIMTTPDAQNVPKTMHRNYFTNQAKGGAKLNESGKALMRHYASASAIEQAGRHKSDFYDQVGGDESITKEMLKYAKEMGDKGVEVSENGKKVRLQADKTKALQAAGWTIAIQKRAGVSDVDIDRILDEAGYDKDEKDKIKLAAKGPTK